MDAVALGGGTIGGTATLMAERMMKLPDTQKPSWMEHKSEEEISEIVAKVIMDAVETSDVVMQYMDAETARGRSFEEAYSEVKPYIEEQSKPYRGELEEEDDELKGAYTTTSSDEQLMKTSRFDRSFREAAPHRTLNRRVDDEWLMPVHMSQTRRIERGSEASLAFDPSEPLLLIGSCNGWSLAEAKRQHTFMKVDRDPTSVAQESKVRIEEVPEDGVSFQIISLRKQWEWRLYPAGNSRASCKLKRGRAEGTVAQLATGKDADLECQGREFYVRNTGLGCAVEIRVSITNETKIQVWYDVIVE
jgi:hypothetical protein